jgi:PXPV repeat (3 copies)
LKEHIMKNGKSMGKWVGAGALALAGLAFAPSASAQNVYWSVGVASPGVQVAVSNAPAVHPQVIYQRPYVVQPQPVYVHPQPVYVQPQPVYVQPAPILSAYPVYGRPVVIQQAPVVFTGWHRPHYERHHGWHHGGHRGHGDVQPQPSPQRGHGGGHR